MLVHNLDLTSVTLLAIHIQNKASPGTCFAFSLFPKQSEDPDNTVMEHLIRVL